MISSQLLEQNNPEGSMGELAKRPRLLFLAYPFPPLQVIGAVRTGNMARYLSRLGWDVTVVTPDPSLWRNVEDCGKVSTELDCEGIKRILTGHRWRCLLPRSLKCWDRHLGWLVGRMCRTVVRGLGIDLFVGWIKAVERACANLNPRDVDVILASGSPFVAFRLARRLSTRLGRPYVLDYRDPWTQNRFIDRPPRLKAIREEASLLEGCAAVTIASPSWGEDLDQRYGIGEKVHVVTNGYDSDEMATVKPYDFGHCAFVYAGSFYPPKISISSFLAALKCLKESFNDASEKWYFHYYGPHKEHVREQAAHYGLSDQIVLHGRVPRRQVLSALKGGNLAVVISSVYERCSAMDKGTIPAKIFEAIGLGTPVLLIAPPGSDATTLMAPTGIVKSFTGADTQSMASFLKDVVCGQSPQPKKSEFCSWAVMSKKLDAILRECMTSTTRYDTESTVGMARMSQGIQVIHG